MMMEAYISLGANLGDRMAALDAAVAALDRLPDTKVTAQSSTYETAAFGVVGNQPDYLNRVISIETEFSSVALLGICMGIEAAIGRERGEQDKAPRVIDMDVLMCGEDDRMIVSNTKELMLPHPRMVERAFVLTPLSELIPSKIAFGMDFSKEFENTSGQLIHKL